MERRLFSILLSLLVPASVHAGDRAPEVFLSHFFVVLDQASFDALRKSARFSMLASVEEKHVEAGTRNWTGFYVRGRRTYMEFFGSDSPPEDARVGDSGLGLTVEESGGVAAIAALLRPAFGERVETSAIPRTTKTGTIPWFTAVELKNTGPQALSTWVMEIDAGFLAADHPGEKIDHPLGREQYLSWKFLQDRILDDVIGVTAALNPSDISELADELEILGWSVQRRGGGFVATGPDVRITVEPAVARAGIQEVDLRLRRSVAKQELVFGSAKLLLEDKSGRFVFWAPH